MPVVGPGRFLRSPVRWHPFRESGWACAPTLPGRSACVRAVAIAGAMALACLPALPASAVEAAPAAVGMVTVAADTVYVYGRRLAETYFPASAGVATAISLDDTTGSSGATDLAELLTSVAGLEVRRYGGLGAQAVPSIRGSSGAQVQVLVDGLPLADAQNGAIDISLLPLERYKSVEVHRGLVPVGFGGIGGAGAINLETRDDAGGSGARVFAGSHGDVGGRAHAAMASADGTRRLLVLAHGRRADNRYGFEPRIPAAQVDLYPDTTWTRENADFAEWGWFLSAAGEGGRGLVRASLGSFRRDGGRPGPFNLPSPHARVRHERLDGRLGLANAARDLALDLTVAREDGQLSDEHREVGLDPAGVNLTTSDDALARLAWSPVHAFGGGLLGVTAGVDGRVQSYRESIAGKASPRRTRRTVSAFASATLESATRGLVITPQWRWQRQRDDFPPVPPLPWLPEQAGVEHVQDAVSPAVNASASLVPGRLVLAGRWHRTVRQPTWVELFGQPGGLVGNRELVPEEITGRDAGLTWTLPGEAGAIRATWFRQATEKTILWYVSGLGQSKPYNIGRTTTEGVEWEALLRRGRVDSRLSFTWQDARQGQGEDPVYHGKRLPFLSEWIAGADLGLRAGAWRCGATIRHESDSYTDLYNDPDARVAPRTLLSTTCSRDFSGGIWGQGRRATLAVTIANLTDQRLHDVEGYPLPGRSLSVSLQWQ